MDIKLEREGCIYEFNMMQKMKKNVCARGGKCVCGTTALRDKDTVSGHVAVYLGVVILA